MLQIVISGLNNGLTPILLKIFNMSITATYCALAVMVLRLLLKRLPKVYSYALWLIVAFRLLCPVSFESVFSLMRVSTEAIPTDIALQENPAVSTGIGRVDVVVNRALTIVTPVVGDSVNPLQIWLFAGSVLWLVVAAAFLGYGIGSYLKMRLELKGAKETEPGVYVSEILKTPFVLGGFKPLIYLPEGLSAAEREYVLEHERTHIRRGDHLIKQGAFLILCVHWFNPVLWASFFLMCKDMEMSCDEKVIKKLSADHTVETKKDYASTLLALASNHQFSFGGPLAFGEGNIKKRIANVLQYKKRTVAVSAALVVVVAVAVFVLVVNPKSEKETGGVPELSVTVTPTEATVATPTGAAGGQQAAVTPNVSPVPEVVIDTSGMEFLMEKDGIHYYYGVIQDTLTETGYFTLNVPEACVDEICYGLELAEQADGSLAVKNIRFYLTEQLSAGGMKRWLEGGEGPQMVQELDAYIWVELKPDLETGKLGDFILALQNCAVINEAGTGGYIHSFPLDNCLEPGTPAFEAYETAGWSFDIRTQLTIHIAPQTVYTAEELAAYAAWQEESLGTKLKENVYYKDITERQVVTPYFELWVPEDCVGKVSYLLTLKENSDGTKAVAGLQYFYTTATEVKADVSEAKYWKDYFKYFSWFGGVYWDTLEGYLDYVWEDTRLDWANAEGTGAYFYQQPSDVQWSSEFEEEYLKLEALLAEKSFITFFAEPEADISPELMQKLEESAGVD